MRVNEELTAQSFTIKNKKTMPYKFKKAQQTTLRVNEAYQGETIEATMRRIWKSGEPIEANAGNSVFYDESEGVPFQVNVRTDRFDKALEMQTQAKKEVTAKGGTVVPKGEAASDKGGEGGE